MILGAHRATVGGRHNAFTSAKSIGCRAIQIFTSSPRQWAAQPVTDEDAERWFAAWRKSRIPHVVAHDSYLINLASPEEGLREKSAAAFLEELRRCDRLGIPYLVTHPGAHVGAGEEDGLLTFADRLRRLYDEHDDLRATTLLETTAGQGTSLGWRFEQLAELLARIGLPERTGICFDTCHAFAAGYDLRSDEGCAATLDALDRVVGLDRLKVIHLNDSKGALGSRVDRHEQIGEGEIGQRAFQLLVTDRRLQDIPMVVETPDLDLHGRNLRRLRALAARAVRPA